MMALSEDGGPAFGAHAFIWADEWTPEGAGRVISGAAVNEALIGATALWRDVIGDPEALVRDGLAFLRARVEEHGAP
jgi:hypothetical protein